MQESNRQKVGGEAETFLMKPPGGGLAATETKQSVPTATDVYTLSRPP